MRKVLFAFDGYLYENDKSEYFGVHVNEEIKQRYLQLGDHVSFLMRKKILDSDKDSFEKFSRIDSSNFSFIEVPNFKSIKNWLKYYKKAKGVIERAVVAHDIIIVRLPTAVGRLTIESARKYNKPHLAEFVGCTFDGYWNYNWKGKLIAHYKLAQMQRLTKDLPYVIYVTKEFLQARYPSKGKQINCSNVELGKIEQIDLMNRLDRIRLIDPKKLTLCTVAAIDVPYKGQDDVIKAISILNRKGWNLSYKIIGQGNPKRLLDIADKYGVQDSIKLLGSIPHAAIFKHLRDIDVYIQPSKQEGLPRALIEAMSVACPSLGAKTAGIPELLSDDAIFQPGRVTQIIKRLASTDKEWLTDAAKKNFEMAKQYQKPILDKRRRIFYHEFLEENGFR